VLLWRDIQNDLVQQMLRRLAAAKLPGDVQDRRPCSFLPPSSSPS